VRSDTFTSANAERELRVQSLDLIVVIGDKVAEKEKIVRRKRSQSQKKNGEERQMGRLDHHIGKAK